MKTSSVKWRVACFNLYSLGPRDAYTRQWSKPLLVQIMACRLFDAKPLSELMLAFYQIYFWTNFNEIRIKIRRFSFKKINWKMSSSNWRSLSLGLKVLTDIALFLSCIFLRWRRRWVPTLAVPSRTVALDTCGRDTTSVTMPTCEYRVGYTFIYIIHIYIYRPGPLSL